MISAFGVDHGDISKMVLRAPKKAPPGARGKLKRLKSRTTLAGTGVANRLAQRSDLLSAAVPRLHT